VIELEQEAEQLLRERIKEMAVPTGSLSKMMTALMGTAKIVTTNKRIGSWMNNHSDKERTLLKCLNSLDEEGMLNKEGRALAIVAQNPSVHAWRHLIDVLVHPRGEGVGRRRREARQLVQSEWKASMPKMRDALQHAMGTAEGLKFQKRMTETLEKLTPEVKDRNYVTWLWETSLEGETEEGLQRAVAEGMIIAQMSVDTWLPRREGEEQQQIASVCWPEIEETGLGPQKPETESTIVGHIGDDKEEMEIVTLNINSMRQAIADGSLLAYIKDTTADFYCLQETMIGVDGKDWKVTAFLRELQGMGYFWYLNAATRNKGGYGGTAVITKHRPNHVHLGLGNSLIDKEGRFMALEYDKWIVINSYVPTLQLDLSGGERKELFFTTMTDKVMRLRQLHKTKRFLWAGDINVCRREADHTAFDPEFPGCSPPERARLEQVLKELDMTDTMPEEQKREDRFTYYDSR